MPPIQLFGISLAFARVSQTVRQVTYVLLTRSPLDIAISFDLHVLGTPPAFILSQDQTLKKFILVQNYNLVYCLKKLTLMFLVHLFSFQRSICAIYYVYLYVPEERALL